MARGRVRALFLRRPLLSGVSLLLLVTFVLRLAWGWHLGRKVRAQFDALRLRGEPVEIADVAFAPVPDAENAVVLLRQAVAALDPKAESPRNSNLEFDEPPYPAQWHAMAAASEAANGMAFRLAREARALPRAQFHSARPISPLHKSVVNRYSTNLRELSSTLTDSALHNHFRGDTPAAVERLLDVWHMADASRQDDTVLGQLVTFGTEAQVQHAARLIGAELFQGGQAVSPAVRERLEGLIARLLDEREVLPRLRDSLRMDRVIMIDYTRLNERDVWAMRPLIDRNILATNSYYDALLHASDAADWPAAQARLSAMREQGMQGPDVLTTFFGTPVEKLRYSRWFDERLGGHTAILERAYRSLAGRRTTATALAVHLYRADHASALPETLDALVPRYLPAVPGDPFAAGGLRLGYVTLKTHEGHPRPMLFYRHGVDKGPPVGPMYDSYSGFAVNHKGDAWQYRDLTRFAPPLKPPELPPKAVDDDPDEPDAPGDDAGEGDRAR